MFEGNDTTTAVEPTAVDTRTPLVIRRLTVKDMVFISEHLKESVKNTGNDYIGGLISSKVEKATGGTDAVPNSVEESIGEIAVNLGVEMFTKSIDYLNGDLAKFFAGLLNKSIEEYEDMDIDTPLRVIQHIKKAPEAQVFFTTFSLLSNVTEWLEKPLSNLKAKYGSIFAEAKNDS